MKFSFEDLLFDPSLPAFGKILLSVQEMKEDLELLAFALDRAYPAAWKMSPEAWARVLGSLHGLRVSEGLSCEEFGSLLADVLWDIPDGHLKVRLRTETLGKKFHKNLRIPTTGANIAGEKVWSINLHQSFQGPVPVIGISWFPQPSEDPWNGFLEEVAKHKNALNMIIDLRGNDGGNDTKAIEMTSLLLGNELVIDWVQEVICESPESYALQINTYEKIILNNYGHDRYKAPKEIHEQIELCRKKASEMQNREPLKTINRLESSLNPLLGPDAFRGRLFVLIDPKTKSSGEWTALYLQKHPNTILVGENTYGMIHFGNSGVLRLPHSQLDITLCMKINELTDGRFFEKTGVPPDVHISGEDSLKYTLAALIK